MFVGFTKTEEYVWYYHSGRNTIRLFRRHDATMIANYALSCEATSLTTTSWSIMAGGRDGTLTILAIADPKKAEETKRLVSSLPSRQREKVEVNGGLVHNPLAKFRAAVRIAVMMTKLVQFLINRKKERRRKRKKGEILEALCKTS